MTPPPIFREPRKAMNFARTFSIHSSSLPLFFLLTSSLASAAPPPFCHDAGAGLVPYGARDPQAWKCENCKPSAKTAAFVGDNLASHWRGTASISKRAASADGGVSALAISKAYGIGHTYYFRVTQTKLHRYNYLSEDQKTMPVLNDVTWDMINVKVAISGVQYLVILPLPPVNSTPENDSNCFVGDDQVLRCTLPVKPLLADCGVSWNTKIENDCQLLKPNDPRLSMIIDPEVHFVLPAACRVNGKYSLACLSTNLTLKFALNLPSPMTGIYAELRDQDGYQKRKDTLLGQLGAFAPVYPSTATCSASPTVSPTLNIANLDPEKNSVEATITLSSVNAATVDGLAVDFIIPALEKGQDGKIQPIAPKNIWTVVQTNPASVLQNVKTNLVGKFVIPWGESTTGKCYYRPCVYMRLSRTSAPSVAEPVWLKNEYLLVCKDVDKVKLLPYCDQVGSSPIHAPSELYQSK